MKCKYLLNGMILGITNNPPKITTIDISMHVIPFLKYKDMSRTAFVMKSTVKNKRTITLGKISINGVMESIPSKVYIVIGEYKLPVVFPIVPHRKPIIKKKISVPKPTHIPAYIFEHCFF